MRNWRGSMASGLVLALAACDTMSSPSGRPVANESPLSQIIAANPMPFTTAEPAPPAIVVRGREPDTRPRIAVPDKSGKSGDVTLNFAGADIRDVVAAILGDTLKVNYVVDP